MLVKKTKNYIFSGAILFLLLVAVFLLPTKAVLAQTGYGDDIVWGGSDQRENVEDITGLGNEDPRIVIANIIRIFLGFLGIVAVILIMYAGWMYMSSQGDESKIQQAKDTLKNAVIGLLIILSAFSIATFIFNMLLNGSNGNSTPGNYPGRVGGGIGALGACALEMVYPLPNQTEVPRNTSIIVTFHEAVNDDDICDGGCSPGASINYKNIRIFKSNEGDACEIDPVNCDGNVKDIEVSADTDNRTFVFRPRSYLGSPTNYTDYVVILSEDIRKSDENVSIFRKCPGGVNAWGFEVSNKIDLTPPQINKAGLYPAPDNLRDDIVVGASVAATGQFQVTDEVDEHVDGTATLTSGNSTITISNFEGCTYSGDIDLIIAPDRKQAYIKESGTGGDSLGMREIINNQVSFSGFFDVNFDSSFTAGETWIIKTEKEVQADYITIGYNVYEFGTDIAISSDLTVLASNITNEITSNDNNVSANANGQTIDLTARVWGTIGNNITLNSSDTDKISFSVMSGGIDGGETTIARGKKDEPMNSIIQISFNEPIMPTFITGIASAIDDIIQVKCEGVNCPPVSGSDAFNCNGDTCLEGTFEIANMYRTLEFKSSIECGVNGCGEKIYCLPASSTIEVLVKAATLDGCTSCNTKNPYNTCTSGHCADADGNFYPLSTTDFDGVMDVCLNSFDGDRSGYAEGPDSEYIENELIATCDSGSNEGKVCNYNNAVDLCGALINCSYPDSTDVDNYNDRLSDLQSNYGDNFLWKFYINDTIDTVPPKIDDPTNGSLNDGINPSVGSADVVADDDIAVSFDKLMMASTLSTGSYMINNGKVDVEHKKINIWGKNGGVVGYWILSENQELGQADNNPDWTKAYIGHTIFADFTTYKAQVGSGVKDVRQNCFKPSTGPGCTAIQAEPSCCNGSTEANLNSEGNCPIP